MNNEIDCFNQFVLREYTVYRQNVNSQCPVYFTVWNSFLHSALPYVLTRGVGDCLKQFLKHLMQTNTNLRLIKTCTCDTVCFDLAWSYKISLLFL